jgi:hypothetical protein
LPARGGGGHTRGFRQNTIPDRREFDKLIESGSREIDFGRFLHPGNREFRRHKIKKGSNREKSKGDGDIFIRVFLVADSACSMMDDLSNFSVEKIVGWGEKIAPEIGTIFKGIQGLYSPFIFTYTQT